ncbi:MAG: peptidylprolyl isomerase [Firmicutes bacterium]|nr:peptidylprolyl isomerase [Bacillota bacterium]
MSEKVLAKIAGKELTEKDYQAFLQKVPAEQRAYAEHPQAKAMYVEQFLTQHLYAQMGEDMNLEETPEFEELMSVMKMEILSQLAMAETLKGIEVTSGEVKAFYDDNKEMFKKGETVKAKHILVDDEAKANELMAAIEAGEIAFEEAAKANSTCPSSAQGGDLGEFGKGQMVPAFEEAAFAAEIGKVAGPVKTDFGYHIILVEAHQTESTLTFDEVRDQIKAQLTQQKSTEAFQAKTAELKAKYLEV